MPFPIPKAGNGFTVGVDFKFLQQSLKGKVGGSCEVPHKYVTTQNRFFSMNSIGRFFLLLSLRFFHKKEKATSEWNHLTSCKSSPFDPLFLFLCFTEGITLVLWWSRPQKFHETVRILTFVVYLFTLKVRNAFLFNIASKSEKLLSLILVLMEK